MAKDLRISVIIPTLNESRGIVAAIDSVKGAYEVFVVDGGSDDNTCELASCAGAIVLESEKGRGVQLRRGAAEANGDVFLFLHGDCFLHSDAIRQILGGLGHNGRAKQGWGCFRQKIENASPKYRLIEWGNRIRAQWFRLPYGDQAIFVSRSLHDRVGGVAAVPLMEDVLLSRQLARLHNPAVLPGPVHVSSRRWEKHGLLRQTLMNWSILAAHSLGVSPKTLKSWYRSHRPPIPAKEHV